MQLEEEEASTHSKPRWRFADFIWSGWLFHWKKTQRWGDAQKGTHLQICCAISCPRIAAINARNHFIDLRGTCGLWSFFRLAMCAFYLMFETVCYLAIKFKSIQASGKFYFWNNASFIFLERNIVPSFQLPSLNENSKVDVVSSSGMSQKEKITSLHTHRWWTQPSQQSRKHLGGPTAPWPVLSAPQKFWPPHNGAAETAGLPKRFPVSDWTPWTSFPTADGPAAPPVSPGRKRPKLRPTCREQWAGRAGRIERCFCSASGTGSNRSHCPSFSHGVNGRVPFYGRFNDLCMGTAYHQRNNPSLPSFYEP